MTTQTLTAKKLPLMDVAEAVANARTRIFEIAEQEGSLAMSKIALEVLSDLDDVEQGIRDYLSNGREVTF